MTWFRCGGSGIPAALKNRMNAVLNKKFGTAVDYPAEGWPDTVNLMGPLPEATASGAIATLEDGADRVPCKNVVATIAPNLAGVPSVTVTQAGRNLFDKNKATTGKYMNVSGQEATNVIKAHSALLPLKPSTTYYMSGHADASYYSILALDKDMNVLSTWYGGASKTDAFTATTPNNARWCYLNFNADQIDTMIFAESSSAISYVEYNGATYTAQLGRTVYGGQVDIVNGVGKGEYGYIVFDGSNDENWGVYSAYNGYYIGISDMKSGTRQDGVCNQLTCSQSTAQGQTDAFWLGVGNSRLYVIGVYDSMGSTIEAFRAYLAENPLILVYPIATPIDFTFDGQEINTRLGYNAFWSDQGDAEVTYRRDIDLALQAVSNNRGLMMGSRPAIEPSNGDQGSEESTENNIETEGEQDAR